MQNKPKDPIQEPERLYGYGEGSRTRASRTERRERLLEAQAQAQAREKRHGLLWAVIAILALWCLGALALFAAPQVLGARYASLPNFFFADGGVIRLDQARWEQYRQQRQALDTQAIYPGVLIDGVDVGGMTVSEARRALEQVGPGGGGSFDITVEVDSRTWHLTSDDIPMTRNLNEMLDVAWAAGRQNSAGARLHQQTPFEERLAEVERLRREGLSLVTSLTWDRDALRARCEGIASTVNYAPVNAGVASFDFNSHRFTFTPELNGQFLSADAVYSAVTRCLESGDTRARLTFTPEILIADVTQTELAAAFGRISGYTTSTTRNNARNTNVRLSAEAINGTVVRSGETFSFNQTVGQRTAEKGYQEAAAIAGGQNTTEIGGGVCQTSSTLFNAVARANLEVVSRSPHAWPSSYVEKGMDATVNWPGLDFKWRNNTDWPVYIVAWYDNRKVTVELYGHTLGEGITIDLESQVVQNIAKPRDINYVQNPNLAPGTRQTTVKAREGYVVETWQVWYRGGKEYQRNKLCTSTYKAYQETVEYN